jgi:hypothetical protein
MQKSRTIALIIWAVCAVLLIIQSYVIPNSWTYRATVTGFVVAFCLLWLYLTATNLDRMTKARDDAAKWANELENMLLRAIESGDRLRGETNELADAVTELIGMKELSITGWKEAIRLGGEAIEQGQEAIDLGNKVADVLEMNMPLLIHAKQNLQSQATELDQKPKFAELEKQHSELAEKVASIELRWIETQAKLSEISKLHAYEGNGQREPSAALTTLKESYHRTKLRRNLAEHFNKDELRTLCFDLGIEHENLPEAKDGMARELVAYCVRTGRIAELVAKCRELRPNVSWPEV